MRLFRYDSLDSTNSEAKRLLDQSPEFLDLGFSILAKHQSKGRGQFSRSWISEPGGFYYTLAIQPNQLDSCNLSVRVGRIVCDVLRTLYAIQVDIEWPNDLILNAKKVGGILIESASSSGKKAPRYLLIGIGINLNQTSFPSEIKTQASSLYLLTKRHFDPAKLPHALAEALVSDIMPPSS